MEVEYEADDRDHVIDDVTDDITSWQRWRRQGVLKTANIR